METDFIPFDWKRILLGLQPPLYLVEVALKCVLVFLLLSLVLRLLGKRGQDNLSPMQQMLLIALGSAAGDVLLYPTVSLAYAALILGAITMLNIGMDSLMTHVRPVRDFVESHPRVLVENGVVDHDAMRRERIPMRELKAELRTHGARSLSQVEHAILEVTGKISVFLHDTKTSDDDLLRDIVAPRAAAPPGH